MTMKHVSHTVAHLLALSIIALADVAQATSHTQLQNPLQFPDIATAVAGFLKVMVMVALPIISLFIVYSGFLFVKAQGNEEQLSKAKTNLLYVIIGSLLILGAWVIATLIGGTVTQILRG